VPVDTGASLFEHHHGRVRPEGVEQVVGIRADLIRLVAVEGGRHRTGEREIALIPCKDDEPLAGPEGLPAVVEVDRQLWLELRRGVGTRGEGTRRARIGLAQVAGTSRRGLGRRVGGRVRRRR
jgi:hypothetical protein